MKCLQMKEARKSSRDDVKYCHTMNQKYYVTTPIYYVNDIPHIGHTCTTLAADALARFAKQQGKEVFFLTGTDEHGAKVVEAASKEGVPPQEFCDQVSQRFRDIWPRLNIQNDYFIRTTNPKHKEIFSRLINQLYDQGEIYKKKYGGWYCVGCEKYITEKDLVDGKCPDHNRPPIWQEEENYFFKLTKYVPILIEAIQNPHSPYYYQIEPEAKRNEVLSRLKDDVIDISISRANVPWGIPIPWDKEQTTYVWIEALCNYYSALEINNRLDFWAKDMEIDHLVGKEILWFHAAVWPAMLIALNLPLPKRIFAHNFYMVDGQKMSKSLGNVIAPEEMIKRYGVDGTRYLIYTSFPHTNDSDVGWSRFTEKYNSDLANGLGNLVSRVARLCEKAQLEHKPEVQFECPNEFTHAVNNLKFDQALAYIWEKITQVDKTFNEQEPWKQSGEALKKTLRTSVTSLHEIAYLLTSFLPQTAEQIKEQFTGEIQARTPLFPKIDA